MIKRKISAKKRELGFSRLLILLILIFFWGGNLNAQSRMLKAATQESSEEATKKVENQEEVAAPKGPYDEFNRGVPRTSVKGFLDATDEGNYESAVNYLDLRYLPKKVSKIEGTEMAKYLRIAIDQNFWVDLGSLSNEPGGRLDDGLASFRDRVGQIELEGEKVDILLQRVPRGDGVRIWKFSNATMAQVPKIISGTGYAREWKWLADNLPDWSFMGSFLWQWVALIGMMLILYLLLLFPTYLVGKQFRRRETVWGRRMDRYIRGPVRFLLLIIIARAFLFDLVDPSVQARAYFDVNTIGTLVFIWFLLKTTDLIRDALKDRSKERGDEVAAIIIRPIANSIKCIVIAILLLVWLDNMGYSITTVLAGLGIGSIALALAAQKSVEDLFGAITLYSSKPINIGDFFRFGDKMGVVEEIDLRFTRVRTLGNSVLTVPNARLASAEIENFTQRKKIWYHPIIRLSNTTTPDQIKKITEEIHSALISHEKVEKESARVRFVGFGEYSLNLEIFSYIKTTNYAEFLKFGEELNLQLLDVVHKSGARIAVPINRNIIDNTPA